MLIVSDSQLLGGVKRYASHKKTFFSGPRAIFTLALAGYYDVSLYVVQQFQVSFFVFCRRKGNR
jgi:hypothetical protein